MNAPRRFEALAVNAEEHFRLALLGVVLDILERERKSGQLDAYLSHFAFLQSYAARTAKLWGSQEFPRPREWRDAVEDWHGASRLPLGRLADIMPGTVAMSAVVMIAAMEEDPRFSLLVEPEGGAPTVGGMTLFLSDLFPRSRTGEIRETLFGLAARGLFVLGNTEHPRIEWSLRAISTAFEVLTGARILRPDLRFVPAAAHPSASSWISPGNATPLPQDHAIRLSSLPSSTTLLRGASHNGRKTFLRMAAHTAERAVIECSGDALANRDFWQEASLIAALSDAVLLIECTPGPGEKVIIPSCPIDAPHLAIVTSQSASIDHGRSAAPFFPIDLPRPDQAARAKHWRAAGWSREANKLADRVLTSGHIHRIAMGSQRETKREAIAAMESSLVSIRDPRLESVAQRVGIDSSLDGLVVGNEEREELRGLALQCRLREELHRSSEAGVKALFSGPSGSGKTLAAKHLAKDLKRPLYRINLAATVNKYIGETEKNLEKVLSAAEELDIVLLLDEGDAMLAKRTDVGSATDRYANMETNFMLQRLEEFRGIIIITTNDGEQIDGAFRRRMDTIIAFRLPDQLARQEILRRQLGNHKVSRGLIDEIACRCSFSGGQLHNIVTHARLLSLVDKCPIADAHLVKSVEREYRKTGEHCPLRPTLAKTG